MDEAIINQAYAITLGKFTDQLIQDLETEVAYNVIANVSEFIDIINIINNICYYFHSHKYTLQEHHKAVHKLNVKQQY